MHFYVRKDAAGIPMWLTRATPFVTWGPRERAQKFASRGEAAAACRLAAGGDPHVTIVAESPEAPVDAPARTASLSRR